MRKAILDHGVKERVIARLKEFSGEEATLFELYEQGWFLPEKCCGKRALFVKRFKELRHEGFPFPEVQPREKVFICLECGQVKYPPQDTGDM